MQLSTIHHRLRQPLTWVISGLIIAVGAMLALATIKYLTLGYNALDLAIFGQVFDQTIHGQWFGATIHPPTYWVDHASPILILLLPLWWAWSSPLALLWFQVTSLAAAAIPLWLISRRAFRSPWWAVMVTLTYLANPLIWRAALYEWHTFSLAPLIIFSAWYLYFYTRPTTRRAVWFGVMIILLLVLREDAALLVAGLAVVIFLQAAYTKRLRATWQWWALPAVAAVGWFVGAQWFIAQATVGGSYKFLTYYGWLGSSWADILFNLFRHPGRVIQHVFWNADHWQLIIGLLLPAGFLALKRLRALLLGVGALGVLLLAGSNSLVALFTHYHLPITVGVTLAVVESLAVWEGGQINLPAWLTKHLSLKLLPRWWPLGLLALATIVAWWPLGVWLQPTTSLAAGREYRQAIKTATGRVNAVASTSTPLPWVIKSPEVLLVDYLFIGEQQLSHQPYVAAGQIDALILDARDTLLWPWRFADRSWYRASYPTAHHRLRQLLTDQRLNVAAVSDTMLIYRRDHAPKFVPYQLTTARATNDFVCSPERGGNSLTDFNCTVQFAVPKTNVLLRYETLRHGRSQTSRLLPLAYGLWRSDELTSTDRLTTHYRLTSPDRPADQVCVSLIQAEGLATYNTQNSVAPQIINEQILTNACWSLLPSP